MILIQASRSPSGGSLLDVRDAGMRGLLGPAGLLRERIYGTRSPKVLTDGPSQDGAIPFLAGRSSRSIWTLPESWDFPLM